MGGRQWIRARVKGWVWKRVAYVDHGVFDCVLLGALRAAFLLASMSWEMKQREERRKGWRGYRLEWNEMRVDVVHIAIRK